MINKATKATLAMFNTLKILHTMMVTITPENIEKKESSQKYKCTKATADPMKLDFERSNDNFLVSFSSGEITKIMESNVQNNSN